MGHLRVGSARLQTVPCRPFLTPIVLAMFLAVTAACDGGTSNDTDTSESPSASGAGNGETGAVDLANLPIGDAVSTAPAVGGVYSCQTEFGPAGPASTGAWIADGTWSLPDKPTVDGDETWPSELEVTADGGTRRITSNGLPDHPTGDFPIDTLDDAYEFDRNPNSITAQDLSFELPAEPEPTAEPTCLDLGAVGILLTGSPFFNALDAAGRDALAYEIQDECQGHPEMSGQYHYHSVTTCFDEPGEGHSALAGYAFDGFGIYGYRGEAGETLTNADLDECHGHAHEVEWDGEARELYHYHATWEYPYTLGCFRGTPAN